MLCWLGGFWCSRVRLHCGIVHHCKFDCRLWTQHIISRGHWALCVCIWAILCIRIISTHEGGWIAYNIINAQCQIGLYRTAHTLTYARRIGDILPEIVGLVFLCYSTGSRATDENCARWLTPHVKIKFIYSFSSVRISVFSGFSLALCNGLYP